VLKLLVFDLDGTLADTREDLAQSVNHALVASGLPPLPLEAVMSRVGNGARNLVRGCLEDARRRAAPAAAPSAGSAPVAPAGSDPLEEAALAAFLDHYREHCLLRTAAYPGVEAALRQLGGYRKSVLTNKPTEPAVRILEGLGLASHFEHVLGGDNPHGRKPDPAALRWLMRAADAPPGRTAMVGDGVQDALAARRAGARLIGFLGGIAPRADLLAEAPDAAVESMESLPGAVAALEARLAGEAR
jgi:phosphoglycolate phosphatase